MASRSAWWRSPCSRPPPSARSSTILTMSGRAGLNLVNTAVGLAIQIGLDLLLIPRIGLAGAAGGWAVSHPRSSPVRSRHGLRHATRVMPFSRAGLASTGLAGVAFLALPLGATGGGTGLAGAGSDHDRRSPHLRARVWRLRRPLRLGELTNTLPGGRRRAG